MQPSPPAIEIRHARPDDFEAVTRIFAGPKAVWGTLQVPHPSPEVWRMRLAEPERGLVSLVACDQGDPVGILGIHGNPDHPRRRHVAMIGMAVRDDCHRRGIGNALVLAAVDMADRWLNLVRLELQVFVDNDSAIRLYRRHGFEAEGTLRAAAFRDGTYADVLQMGRVRSQG